MAPERAPSLLVIAGPSTGIRYVLDKDELVIGRASASDIQVLDEAVSRKHATVRRAGPRTELVDHSSQNGSIVNGRRAPPIVELSPGDRIEIGTMSLLFDPPIDVWLGGEGERVWVAEPAPTVVARELEVPVTGAERQGAPAERRLELLARAVAQGGRGSGKELVRDALGLIAAEAGAERGMVLEAPRADGRPRVLAAVGEGDLVVSRTVFLRVFSERRAIASGNAVVELRPDGASISLAAGEIRSLLAIPLVVDGRAIGMLHLDRREANAFPPGLLGELLPAANMLALIVLAAEHLERERQATRLKERSIEAPDVVANGPAMKRLLAEAHRVAESDATVLLEGETGAGKEVLARLLHATSPRRDGPFVAVNCGALVHTLEESELFGHEKGAFTGADARREGLFEAARGGTLFLDEIGEISPSTQVKLLRVLQERVIYRVGGTHAVDVDVRIVAASARSLRDMAARGELREDLFYRLSVVTLRVPPLRERPEDVGELLDRFASQLAAAARLPAKRFTAEAKAALAARSWPGNVRELRNAVERLVISTDGPEIGLADLPSELLVGTDVARRAVRAGDTMAEVVERIEREMIQHAMVRTGGVKTAAADALGISRVTLDAKLKAYGIAWKKG